MLRKLAFEPLANFASVITALIKSKSNYRSTHFGHTFSIFFILLLIYLSIYSFITQAVRPGFKFRLSFFSSLVTNCRLVSKAHASPVHAYMVACMHMEIYRIVVAREKSTSSPGPSPRRFSKWRIVGRKPWAMLN